MTRANAAAKVPTFVNAILQDLPLPARLVPWPKAPPTTLTKCVALALLLHVWLVLLLGNAPGGTAQQGLGVWGAINVTLRGPVRDGPPSVVLPPVPAPANTQPGDAPMPRWGGAVRAAGPPPAAQPGAARLGETAPRMAVPAPAATIEAPAVPVAPAPVLPPAPPARPGRVVQEQAAPAPLPPAVEAVREPAPDPAPAPATATATATATAPAPATATATTPATAPAPAAAEAQLSARALRAAPALQPAIVPTTPPLLPPPALALPAIAAAPALADAPPVLRQLQAPAQAAAAAVQPPLPRSSDLPPPPTLAPAAVPGASLPTARAATPALQGVPHAPGAVDAGAQVGHDVATPPAAAASATPRLNLQLSRPRGGELSRYSSTGVLPVLPRPPERDEKLAREIERAGKTDCRNAYTGMGPLAVIPLALDAVRKDGGCKW